MLAKKNAKGESCSAQSYGPWMRKAFGLLARAACAAQPRAGCELHPSWTPLACPD